MAHACLLRTPSPSRATGWARPQRDDGPRYGGGDVAGGLPQPDSECPGYYDLGRVLGIGWQQSHHVGHKCICGGARQGCSKSRAG